MAHMGVHELMAHKADVSTKSTPLLYWLHFVNDLALFIVGERVLKVADHGEWQVDSGEEAQGGARV